MGVTTSSTVAATYEPLITYTVPSAVATVTLGSGGQGTIPSTYTDLVLIALGKTTDGAAYRTLLIRPNNDTNSNYSVTYMGGDGSTAYSNRTTNESSLRCGYLQGSGSIQTSIISFFNYSNSTTYKTALIRYGGNTDAVDAQTNAQVGLWRSTSAITSFVLSAGAGNIDAGSIFTLYGIKGA